MKSEFYAGGYSEMVKDMTKGSPLKVIFAFSIPLLIGNVFQQLYSMMDTLIVGRTINVEALAAIGCTGSFTFFIIGFVQGFTNGICIYTAQRFGAGDEEGVKRSFAACIYLSVILTIIMTAVSVIAVKPGLEIMKTPSNIIDDAYRYIIVIFWGIGATVLFNLLSSIIRALGDSRTPLYFLIIASILNIILDYLFILGFHMGVEGAGWATVISQLISGILCIFYIQIKIPMLRINLRDYKITNKEYWCHLRIGLPMGFQSSIIAIGAIAVQMSLNSLGSVAVAANTAAGKIDMIATQPAFSFGVALSNFAAQNYGANQLQRIKKGVWQGGLLSVGTCAVTGVIVAVAGKYLVQLFVGGDQIKVISYAETYLIINGLMYVFLAVLLVFRYCIQGLGNNFAPTIAGVMELVTRVAVAAILLKPFGFMGICWAGPLAWVTASIPVCINYYKLQKEWGKTVEVIEKTVIE